MLESCSSGEQRKTCKGFLWDQWPGIGEHPSGFRRGRQRADSELIEHCFAIRYSVRVVCAGFEPERTKFGQ